MQWTESDIEILINNYPTIGKLKTSEILNRSEASVRYMASNLGLRLDKSSEFFIEFQKRAAISKIGKKRPKHSIRIKELIASGRYDKFIHPDDANRKMRSISARERIAKNGHPKGFLGKHRTEEEKQKISEQFRKMWKDKGSKVNTAEHRQAISDRVSINNNKLSGEKMYSRAKKGKAIIGGKEYFYRSSWEPNVACYLEFLKKKGEIKDWFYEKDTFWFDKIKRGVRSYKPDFKVIKNDDTVYYEEVKGWLDDKSKTKLNRMRIYYPEIDIRLLDSKRYSELSKLKSIIPNWGQFLKD